MQQGHSQFRVRLSGTTPSDPPDNDPTASRELCLIDAGIRSMRDLPLTGNIQTLNLHCNGITRIENLQHLPLLRHLDLSSNGLVRIDGLEGLGMLRTLNVACNQLTKVSGLRGLRSLTRLNASYNQIQDIAGLRELHGPDFNLTHLHLHGNQLTSAEHVIGGLVGLSHLCAVTFIHEQSNNPVCQLPGYRTAILNSLPWLNSLDGQDRSGNPVQSDDGLADIPGLEQYLDYLLSSDVGSSAEQEAPLQIITPKIDQVLEKFRQRAQASLGTTSSTTETDERRDVVGVAMMKQSRGRHSRPDVQGQAVMQPSHSPTDHEERLKVLEQQLVNIMRRRTWASDVSHSHESPDTEDKAEHITERKTSGRVAKRDTDHTDESDLENQPGSENRRRKRQSGVQQGGRQGEDAGQGKTRQRSGGGKTKTSQIPTKAKPRAGSVSSSQAKDTSTSVSSGPDRKSRPSAAQRLVPTTAEQDADKLSLLQELDKERERRWKAEQAAIRLADHIKDLQSQANEEKELQEVAIHASGRLKQAVMNEKEINVRLEDQNGLLKEKVQQLSQKLSMNQNAEEEQRQALRAMEDTAKKMETERLKQQAHDAKRLQEYQLRSSATERELELVRAKSVQQEAKIHQLQELLATREQEHRNELQNYYKLGSKEIQGLIDRELNREREKQEHGQIFYKERIEILTKQYNDLEDEFRLALQIESNRFHEIQDAYEKSSQEAAHHKQALNISVEKERRSSGLAAELTAMVKEQKGRITELLRAKQETISSSRSRIQNMERQAEENQRKLQILEALKQEKSRLAAQLVAQESVIEGLKSERKLWGQELAQQGASLAQDRGRLEARIEALDAEVASLKKQLERENDALKIKTKVMDDQTDTIKKLKDALLDKDDQVKAAREETLRIQQSLEDQLATEQSAGQEMTSQLERLTERKEQLKERVVDLQADLEDSQRAYRALDNKWKEKADIIGQLEGQVRQVKENFDQREKKLKEERDRAVQAEKASLEKLRSMDNAFRSQMEAAQRGHDDNMEQLQQDKQAEIDEALNRVSEVEDEMRHLLAETANQKRVMEEKIRRLTQAFTEIQDLG